MAPVIDPGAKPSRFFTTGENIDPSVRGRKPFDRNPTGTRIALQGLQAGTIIALIVAFFSVWIGMSASTETKYLPYAVVQNPQTGELAFAGSLTESNLVPGDRTTQLFLKNFILKLRSVSSDKSVLLFNRDAFAHFVLDSAALQIDQMHSTYDPFVFFSEKKTVDLQFLDSTKTSDLVWIVRWVEIQYSEGNITSRLLKSGKFTLQTYNPESLETAKINPYNLRITDFNITDLRDPS